MCTHGPNGQEQAPKTTRRCFGDFNGDHSLLQRETTGIWTGVSSASRAGKRRKQETSGDTHIHEAKQRAFWLHPPHDARPGWQGSGKLPGGMNEGEATEKLQRPSIKAPVLWSRCRGRDNSPFLPTEELGVSKSSYRAADLRTNKRQCFFHATRD